MNDIAIRIENLGKQYRIGGPKGRYNYKRFSETAMAALKAPLRRLRTLGQPADSTETFWALRDVSFEVKEGEAVGIIGRNGAGKSTLLKILSRITEPTEGRAEIRGRVGSLLEVGTGFHPELTGRENIYLNGAILGMKKPEINRKFDEIVEFAEIGKFLDTPVKRYSSGMYVRLAFAVAAYLEPQILLVDEVLAVGDAAFQKKCLGKMGEVAGQGRTVLFVSHNMASIRSLCNRGILLDTGQVVSDDTMDNVVHEYVNRITKPTDEHSVELSEHPSRLPGMHPILTAVSIKNSDLSPCRTFFQSEEIVVEFTFDGREFDRSPGGAGFILEAANGSPVGAFNTYMTDYTPECFPECGMVRFRLKSPKLIAGRYLVTVSVGANQHSLIDKVDKAISFDVLPEDIYGTGFLLTPALGVVALQCDAKVVETS